MALVLTIDGVAVDVERNTLSIPQIVEGRTTASFVVANTEASGIDTISEAILALAGVSGYWSLGEASGNALDSKNSNNGTVTLGAGVRDDAPLDDSGDGSINFDGADTKVQIADDAAIQNIWDGGGSLFAVINANSDGETNLARIADKSSWHFRVASEAAGKIRLQFICLFTGLDGRWETDRDFDITKTYVVGVSYDSDAMDNNPIIYVVDLATGLLTVYTVGGGNLTEFSTPTGTRDTDVGSDLIIGNEVGQTRTFDGRLDEVAIFTTSFSQAEFVTLAAIVETFPGETARYVAGQPVVITDGGGDLPTAILALTGVAAYWRLGEPSGNALDSKNSNDGVVTIGAGARDAASIEADGDGSIEFDGVDTKIQVSDDATIQNIWDGGGGAFAIINAVSDGENNAGRILDKAQWTFYILEEAAGKYRLGYVVGRSGLNGWWKTDVDLDINKSYVVGVTYDADSVSNDPTIFVVDIATGTLTVYTIGAGNLTEVFTPNGVRSTDVGDDLVIGNETGQTRTFDGRIDELAIFTTSFSQAEFVALVVEAQANFLFKGVVATSREKRMAPAGGLHHSIKCVDWHYLLDKRLVAEAYTAKTAAFIVNDLITNYFAAEGVSAGTIQTGPTIAEALFNYAPGSAVMDVLAERSGFTWYVDDSKSLHFKLRTTTAAPFAVTTADFLKGSSSITHGNSKYRNRQYIKGGRGLTSSQTETFTTQDATIKSFQLGYPLASVPTVTEDAGGKTVGIKGIDTAVDYYWAEGDEVVVAAVAPGAGVVVEIVYVGQFDVIAFAEDPLEIATRLAIEGAGTGFVERLDDDPSLTDDQDALDEAEAKLERYGVAGKQLRFSIRTSGLEVGQLLTVTEVLYGLLAATMLVAAIEIAESDQGIIYKILAVEGPVIGSWEQFFYKMASGKEDVRLLAGLSTQILLVLSIFTATTELSELVVQNVFACPVPSSSLNPDPTLFPC